MTLTSCPGPRNQFALLHKPLAHLSIHPSIHPSNNPPIHLSIHFTYNTFILPFIHPSKVKHQFRLVTKKMRPWIQAAEVRLLSYIQGFSFVG